MIWKPFFKRYPGYEKSKTKVPIGIDVDVLNVEYFDMSEPFYLIIGGSQTGKTNILSNVLQILGSEKIYLMDSSSLEL